MSLTFGAVATDRVDCGSASGLDNLAAGTMTAWAWVYRTGAGGNQHLLTKDNAFPSGWVLVLDNGVGVGQVLLIVYRATTRAEFLSNSSNVAAANAWTFVAATFDQAASPTGRLYLGTLSTLVTEVSGYETSQNGSGTPIADATASLWIGNIQRTAAHPFAGRIGACGLLSRVLSVGELQSLQYHPRNLSGSVGLWRLGDNGTGTQPDLSGNGNAGTVTGATQIANPPLARSRQAMARASSRFIAAGPKAPLWILNPGY